MIDKDTLELMRLTFRNQLPETLVELKACVVADMIDEIEAARGKERRDRDIARLDREIARLNDPTRAPSATCGTCRFAHVEKTFFTHDVLCCRRFPPSRKGFPRVLANESCGAWERPEGLNDE